MFQLLHPVFGYSLLTDRVGCAGARAARSTPKSRGDEARTGYANAPPLLIYALVFRRRGVVSPFLRRGERVHDDYGQRRRPAPKTVPHGPALAATLLT